MSGSAEHEPDLVLRPMEPNETGAASAVHVAARLAAAERGTMPPPVHPVSGAERWFAEEVAPHREVWVAEQGGRLVAVLVLDRAFVDQLYVHPDREGRGIGTALLRLAMALRPGGFGLWVFAVNDRARALYEANGLVPVQHTDGAGNEERAPDVRYEWRPPGVGAARHPEGK